MTLYDSFKPSYDQPDPKADDWAYCERCEEITGVSFIDEPPYYCEECMKELNIKFCVHCMLKTPHIGGECKYCQEQEANDRKEERSELLNFAREVSEITREVMG